VRSVGLAAEQDFQQRPVPLLHDTQLHQHTAPSLRSANWSQTSAQEAQKLATSTQCREGTGTTVAHLPETRPQPVTREPELRCPASTGIAQALTGVK
jgi:hypothetical protein